MAAMLPGFPLFMASTILRRWSEDVAEFQTCRMDYTDYRYIDVSWDD